MTGSSELLGEPSSQGLSEAGQIEGADGELYGVHPLPDVDSIGYRFGQAIEPISERVPAGAIAKGFVYGSVALGVARAISKRSSSPLITVTQGHAGGAVANTLLSLVSHRMAPHGSVPVENGKIFEGLRLGLVVLGGVKPYRSAPMHRVHHKYSDTPLDPHSPKYHGRFPVFFGITGITRQFERSNPGLVLAEQQDFRTRAKGYDKSYLTVAGVLVTHVLLGKMLKQSVAKSVISAGIHLTDAYLLNATFTADSHMSGRPKNIDMGLLSVLFPEENHAEHHENPGNPSHARLDIPHAIGKLLRRGMLNKTQ